jgi:hypothetical protein
MVHRRRRHILARGLLCTGVVATTAAALSQPTWSAFSVADSNKPNAWQAATLSLTSSQPSSTATINITGATPSSLPFTACVAVQYTTDASSPSQTTMYIYSNPPSTIGSLASGLNISITRGTISGYSYQAGVAITQSQCKSFAPATPTWSNTLYDLLANCTSSQPANPSNCFPPDTNWANGTVAVYQIVVAANGNFAASESTNSFGLTWEADLS